MLVKTEDDFYIFLSPNIVVTASDIEITNNNDVLVTQLLKDGSIKIYGPTNQNVLNSDIVVTTNAGTFNYSTLIYNAETTTNLAKLTFGNGQINQQALDNYYAANSQASPEATNGNGDSGTTGTGTDGSNNSNNNSGAASGSGGSSITGLQKLIDDLLKSRNAVPPKVTVDVNSGYSTITSNIEVFDPNASIDGDLEVFLYDINNNLISFKEVTPEQNVKVTFDTLKPDTQYRLDVVVNYRTADGEEFSGTFYSGSTKTGILKLDVAVIYQNADSITYNVKTAPEQNVTSASFSTFEKNILGDSEVDNTELDLSESNTVNGQNITVSALRSNQLLSITVSDLIVAGSPVDQNQTLITTTLKKVPTAAPVIAFSDPMESLFRVISPNITDPDNSISEITYEVYERSNNGNQTYVTSVTKDANTINEYASIYVDGVVLKRNTTYQFRVILSGYDNLNNFEVTSDFSSNYIMTGVEPPSVGFTTAPNNVSFNQIILDAEVFDPSSSIVGSPTLEIYKGTEKLGTEYTLSSGQNNGLQFPGLTALTTYTFRVVADIDLQDGEGIRYAITIGQTLVTTENIQDLEVTYEADFNCPTIDGIVDSCINTTSATNKILAQGASLPYISTMNIR